MGPWTTGRGRGHRRRRKRRCRHRHRAPAERHDEGPRSEDRGPSAMVGDTGIEPVTSSVSGKRATAAPIARDGTRGCRSRWVRDSNPCTRLCRPLPRLSANPPGDALASYGTALPTRCRERRSPGADDRIRTGDPHLGKVMLYQLSYVRRTGIQDPAVGDTGIEPVTSSV